MSVLKIQSLYWKGMNRRDILSATLIAAQVAVLFATRIWQEQRFSDDAYIHFRCALNFSQGLGLVFNPGEWVLGTTSPCWSFLLGVLHALIRVPIPELATWLNFGIDVGIMLMSLRWFRRAGLNTIASHAAALLLSLEHWRMFFSSTGLELSLFILVLMASFEALERRSWIASGILLGIIGWIRPEGSLVWLAGLTALLLTHWNAKRDLRRDLRNDTTSGSGYLTLAWKSYAVAILLALGVAAVLSYFYGSFLPQSMMAKAHAPWFKVGGGLSHVMFFIRLGNLTPAYPLTGFQAIWGRAPDNLNSILISGVQVGMMTAGAWTFWRRGGVIIAPCLLFFVLGYYLFFSILQPPIFEWYFIPYYFVSLFLSCIGWYALLKLVFERLSSNWPSWRRSGPLLAEAAFVLLMLLSMRTLAFHAARSGRLVGEGAWESLQFRYRALAPTEKEIQYAQIAERLREIRDRHPEARVACTEIGIFGYYFGGNVLDIYGLVSPEALEVTEPLVHEKLPSSCREHPLNVWMAHKPEVIMSAWRWVPRLPEEFQAEYEEASWNDTELAVFVRRDWAAKIVVE